MTKHYESPLTKCPYYQWSQSNVICCEGVSKKNTVRLHFEVATDKRTHETRYCQSHYSYCGVCKMLNGKYGVSAEDFDG